MVQGLKFLSKKSFHPQNRSNQKRVWEHEQGEKQEQDRIRAREAQLRRERDEEEIAQSRGDNKLKFLYQPPPGMEAARTGNQPEEAKASATASTSSLYERQPGDDDAAAAFRRLLAGEDLSGNDDNPSSESSTAKVPVAAFGTVLQGSNADRSDAAKPQLSALEKSVGRKKQNQNLTFEEQIQRFPALANAPRVKGVSGSDVGVTFHPLGTQIRNVQCMACGIWGHSRGDRECQVSGWDPFASKKPDAAIHSEQSKDKLGEESPSNDDQRGRSRDSDRSRGNNDRTGSSSEDEVSTARFSRKRKDDTDPSDEERGHEKGKANRDHGQHRKRKDDDDSSRRMKRSKKRHKSRDRKKMSRKR